MKNTFLEAVSVTWLRWFCRPWHANYNTLPHE